MNTQKQPVGLYRDPERPTRYRYWDGEQWQSPSGAYPPAQRREPPDQGNVSDPDPRDT